MGDVIYGNTVQARTGMVFKTDPKTGQMICTDEGRVIDARDDRIAELEAEIAGWKRVACEAAIPLEAMRMAGVTKRFSPTLSEGVDHAIGVIRRAVMGDGLPPAPASPKEASHGR